MRRKAKTSAEKNLSPFADQIQGEPLFPVRVVERELTSPNGKTLKVQVPVYPPFQLKKRPAAKPPRSRKVRRAS